MTQIEWIDNNEYNARITTQDGDGSGTSISTNMCVGWGDGKSRSYGYIDYTGNGSGYTYLLGSGKMDSGKGDCTGYGFLIDGNVDGYGIGEAF